MQFDTAWHNSDLHGRTLMPGLTIHLRAGRPHPRTERVGEQRVVLAQLVNACAVASEGQRGRRRWLLWRRSDLIRYGRT
jgi:hypothetical protein